MDQDQIKRFRMLGSEHRFETGEERRSLRMSRSVSGDSKFLDRCEIKQSGVEVASAEGPRACDKALDDFEKLVRQKTLRR